VGRRRRQPGSPAEPLFHNGLVSGALASARSENSEYTLGLLIDSIIVTLRVKRKSQSSSFPYQLDRLLVAIGGWWPSGLKKSSG
jgi:hypothetical protein